VTVLDVGCGSLKRGSVGIDIQRTASVDVVADVHRLPLRDGSINGCIAYSVLEHVNNPLQVIREVNRVLQERGWFEIRVPRDSRLRLDTFLFCATLNVKLLKQQYSFLKTGAHQHQFSTRALKRILKMSGSSANCVIFSAVRLETKHNMLVDIFRYLRNIYIVAEKVTALSPSQRERY